MCGGCGLLGRYDMLKQRHFPNCRGDLEKGESGFLKVGKMPKHCTEPYKDVLNEIYKAIEASRLKKETAKAELLKSS